MKNIIARQRRMIQFNTSHMGDVDRFALAGTGLVGEFGEVAEAHEAQELIHEVGDFLWYAHLACIELDLDFEALLKQSVKSQPWKVLISPARAWLDLSRISEFVKKVSITKQKIDMLTTKKIELASKMLELMEAPIYIAVERLPGRVGLEHVILENIAKLEKRHNRKYE